MQMEVRGNYRAEEVMELTLNEVNNIFMALEGLTIIIIINDLINQIRKKVNKSPLGMKNLAL